MKIAVDFDGTIVEDRYPSIGKPVPYAIETLLELQKKGHILLLWTAREGRVLNEAVEYCRSKGLEFYSVNGASPAEEAPSGPRKVIADVYIDDRNLGGLPDWATIARMIEGEIPESHSVHRSRSKKKNIFKRIAYRCRKSRERFG